MALSPSVRLALGLVAPPPAPNTTPVASASGPSTANEGDTVGLDGSASSDEDADQTLTFAWTVADVAVPVSLNNAMTATPSFVAPDNGTYTFQLIVDDGQATDNLSLPALVSISVSNVAPTLSPLDDVGTPPNTPVSVSGTFTDPGTLDSHTVSINWDDGTSSDGQVTATSSTASG